MKIGQIVMGEVVLMVELFIVLAIFIGLLTIFGISISDVGNILGNTLVEILTYFVNAILFVINSVIYSVLTAIKGVFGL